MSQVATVVAQQTLQFDVPGAAPNVTRVFVTTGIAQFSLQVFSQTANQASQSDSIRLLVDPVLAPGQFRKSTAMVSFANVQHGSVDGRSENSLSVRGRLTTFLLPLTTNPARSNCDST